MRIGIDARLYGTKHRGLGRYVQKLVNGVVQTDRQNDYVLFFTKDNIDSFKERRPNVKMVLLDARWYSLKEQLIGARIIKKEQVDLMHFPHFNVPFLYHDNFVVTIHDLIIKHFPDSRATNLPDWKYKLKLLGFDKVLHYAIKQSAKIIVPSNFVKNDVISMFGVSENKITVIYEGYFLDSTTRPADLARFKLTRPFLLYVGSAYPHKNLERLVNVFKKINQTKKYQLVLVGEMDKFYQRLKSTVGARDGLVFTGYLSESELLALYQQARLYVFPSLSEGFGLPPLEAQGYGVPVVAADSSCLPEVLGESAVYFNPNSDQEMIKQITAVLLDKELRAKLVKQGFENVKKYSWDKMVDQTLKIYRQA